ncbi:flagellar protein [Ruminococcaceae bacterium OttesenSCG-928-L11]|nr:flagellar protein [Ruminococcaceae bacterium OttesenSCG-928-L11]
MKDFRLPPTPIITGAPQSTTTRVSPQGKVTGQSFREMLGQAVEQNSQKSLTLSRHAMQRVEQRSIALSESDMQRMESALDKAQDKGITDTLIFMNNTAFIVNVPNKVVVTVVDGSEAQESIFTNINGAVIL